MVYGLLRENHPNFQDYTVKIPRSDRQLIAAVKQLIEERQRIYVKYGTIRQHFVCNGLPGA